MSDTGPKMVKISEHPLYAEYFKMLKDGKDIDMILNLAKKKGITSVKLLGKSPDYMVPLDLPMKSIVDEVKFFEDDKDIEENPYKFPVITTKFADDVILDFYFFDAHGLTISTTNNYYPIRTNFKAITFYSQPYETYIDKLLPLFKLSSKSNYVCKFIYGACPKIPIIENGIKKVYMPPLIFTPDMNDYNFQKHMGLYHFKFKRNNNDVCEVVSVQKIKSNKDLIDEDYLSGITYTDIFGWIKEDCNDKGINPENVMVGIMSCQNYDDDLVGELESYNYDAESLVPKAKTEILNKTKYVTTLDEIKNENITLCAFYNEIACNSILKPKTNNTIPSALLTDTTKCVSSKSGVELLVLHETISKTEYNEKIICGIDMEYDDIFKVFGYISNDPVMNLEPYIVIRFPNIMGLEILLSFFYSLIDTSYEYELVTYYLGKNTPLQSLILCNKQLYYQSINSKRKLETKRLFYKEKNIEYKDTNIEYLNSKLNSDYVDIVFNIEKNKDTTNYSFDEFLDILKRNNGELITPDYMKKPTPQNIEGSKPTINSLPKTDRQFSKSWMFDEELKKGGKRKSAKGKKTRKDKKKKNKTRKIKRGGSDLDPFEKVMLELDNKHKNKSVLIV